MNGPHRDPLSSPEPPRINKVVSHRLSVWQVPIIGIVLSVMAALGLYQWEYRLAYSEQQARYHRAAQEGIQILRDRIVHALEQVHYLAAFYMASEEVSDQEFHSFATHLLAHESSIQSLGWAPRIIHDQRTGHEAARASSPGFQITEPGSPGLRLGAYRREYFPAGFVLSSQGDEAVLGFDWGSEPIRQEALDQARDTGKAVVSGRVALLPARNPKETASPLGILVAFPVYHGDESPAMVEQRRRNLLGFVVGVFRVDELVEDALHHLKRRGIDLWLFEQSDPTGQWLLHGGYSHKEAPQPAHFQMASEETPLIRESVEFAGQQWSVVAMPATGQFLPTISATPWVVLLAGLIIIGLLTAYLITLRSHAARLAYQAHHDSLTGLPNRHLLQDRLQQALSQAGRHQGAVAVMLVDLDNFKQINDSLGHQAGDRLLQVTAKRLSSCVREGDTVARLGGDEFMLVLAIPNNHDQEHLPMVVERVLSNIAHPLQLEGHEVVVDCSIGVSLYPRDGENMQTLLKNADAAMYQAKALGGRIFRFYQPEMNAQAQGYYFSHPLSAEEIAALLREDGR